MAKHTHKLSTPPVIDLAYHLSIIDDSGIKLVWKRLTPDFFGGVPTAKKHLRKLGLKGAWMKDQTGDKQWVTL